MSPRQDPTKDRKNSQISYPLHDLEAQTPDLPPLQDAGRGTVKSKQTHVGHTKAIDENKRKYFSIPSVPGKDSKQTYFDNMPIVLKGKTTGALSLWLLC